MAPSRRSLTRALERWRNPISGRAPRSISKAQLQTRKWQDASGNDKYSTEVVLQKFRGELVLLDSRDSGGGGGSYRGGDYGDDAGGSGSSRPQSRPQPAAFDTDLDDDVPF